MSDQGYQHRYADDLRELLWAAEASGKAFAGYAADATSPELKEMMAAGKSEGEKQIATLQELLQAAGAAAEGRPNAVVAATIAAGRTRVDGASGVALKDLAVIDALRVTLHYYIAAFDMTALLARRLGREDGAGAIGAMRDHMIEKDADYARLAA